MAFALTVEQKKKLIKLLQEIVRYADLEALALVTRTGMSVAFFSWDGCRSYGSWPIMGSISTW
ncbi:MAG: hypothetical protein ACW964_07650 [Candidatus Hodarchaeales archaeon]|jgi:hypothetical protein